MSYVREGTKLHGNTRNALIKRGWLTEDGKVTDEGYDAGGIPTVTTTWLEMGTNVQIGKYVLPKGLRLPLTWRNQKGNNRRNWYYTVSLPINDGKDAVDLNISYSPKHLVKVVKLPLDR